MKKQILTLALGAVLGVASASAQSYEAPMITFKTNIYDTYGTANSFHIVLGTTEPTYLDIDCGYGAAEYEVNPATFDSEAGAVTGTTISLQASADGIVKIYGDPALLDYFDAEGCYIDWIDFGDCTNLDILDMQHNELKQLDLSKYTKLSAIYLTDNPFTEATPLIIGNDHPNLMILEVDIVDYISPDFDISYYPELMSFDAYANKTLTHLDPTKCPKLVRLSVDSCPIKSLDVSKNPDLQVLNIEDSGISQIDLSHNTKLQQLYATHESGTLNTDAKLSSIDLSNNPELVYALLGGNKLTSIDVSKNTKLQWLTLSNNELTDIDIENNLEIFNLNLNNNRMGFATLPLPRSTFAEYYYAQRPMPTERSYEIGSEIDFSAMVLREGSTTDCVLYSYNLETNAAEALDESYFKYADGKVTLLKECADSLYLSFGNTLFPASQLLSERFMVKNAADFGKPSPAISYTSDATVGAKVELSLGVHGATAGSPRKIYVDFGNGELVEFSVTAEKLGATPNVTGTLAGSEVTVYTAEGESLSAFGISGGFKSLSTDKSPRLEYLSATSGSLRSIDLSYNRDLRSLDLSGNKLTSLSLEGVNGLFGKNMLSDINLSHNNLTDVTLNDTRAINSLDLSDNKFTEFDYKEFENLENFDISNNKIEAINITYFTAAKNVNLSGNKLSEITLPETYVFDNFDISDNLFTFATLPLMGTSVAGYRYAPQAQIVLPAKAPGVDLSAQNRVVDGVGTTFSWYKEDGTVLSADEVQVTDGRTLFIDPSVGRVYCMMTNPAFAQLSGEEALRTTVVEAADMPTHVVAEFTTVNSGDAVSLSMAAEKDGTAVYIDWSGAGYSLEQYQLGTTYRLFNATTQAGANVKVYTYDTTDHLTVFSIGGAAMNSFDASALTSLVCLGVTGAGLESITLPESDKLSELYLDNNAIETIDFSRYPNLSMLSLSGNKLSSLDLSKSPALAMAAAGDNKLESVTLDNDNLWYLDLSGNQLSDIDLTGASGVSQLSLSHNNLESLDVTSLNSLIQLLIDHNKFTFATLPMPRASFVQYVFGDQANIDVECVEGKVDLSAQASVGDVATDYAWYIGTPVFDDNGNLSGEQLYVDDEYTLENGVTTFLTSFDNLVCVMTNSTFNNLYLFTNPLDAAAGVSDAISDNLAGLSVRVDGRDVYVSAPGVADGTPVAFITLDGRITTSAKIVDGNAVLSGVSAGNAVIAVGNRGCKVVVK